MAQLRDDNNKTQDAANYPFQTCSANKVTTLASVKVAWSQIPDSKNSFVILILPDSSPSKTSTRVAPVEISRRFQTTEVLPQPGESAYSLTKRTSCFYLSYWISVLALWYRSPTANKKASFVVTGHQTDKLFLPCILALLYRSPSANKKASFLVTGHQTEKLFLPFVLDQRPGLVVQKYDPHERDTSVYVIDHKKEKFLASFANRFILIFVFYETERLAWSGEKVP
jgi:hypothetical protein